MSAPGDLTFTRARVVRLLEQLERLAAGDEQERLDLSPLHDELDAIAFGIKVLADELRWAHARMTESERVNFATAFHSNPCAMAIVRLSDGRFQDVNQGFERQTGYSRSDVIGRTQDEIGLWIDPADLAAIAEDVRQAQRVTSREVQYRTRHGEAAIAVYSADIIHFHGEPCVLSAAIDVTDRKKAERQAASLRRELAHRGRVVMLDALTASLAHEINQPLTAIMSNAQGALNRLNAPSPSVDDLRPILQDVLADGQRAADVIRRMRTLLRKTEPRRERVDLNNTIGAVMKLVDGHVADRRITLVTELSAMPGHVMGDHVQIQQVVLNLLMNAFDAAQTCEPAERLVRLTTRFDKTAMVDVSDRGSGMADEALAEIFEPFYTTKREGLGLGLWICREIVTAHGGTLTGARNPEGGMTFTAVFPLSHANEESDSEGRPLSLM